MMPMVTGRTLTGSSPLVRGKHKDVEVSASDDRIIPACAGQTHSFRPQPCGHSDHPRLCGANLASIVALGFAIGSSPLVRGKRAIIITITEQARIIPACAGQTIDWLDSNVFTADHPRLCGANRALADKSVFEGGSSPLVRGKRCLPEEGNRLLRIIPACAGQAGRKAALFPRVQDHPRLCGANETMPRL